MAYEDDEDSVALLDEDEKDRERKGSPSILGDDEPVATAAPEKPPQSITGPSEPTTQPTSITAGPLEAKPALGPAGQREQDLLSKGPPQYHGWKKAADILGRVTAPGRVIEAGTGLGTLGYEHSLGQAAKDAALETQQAKAPLDVSYEQAKTREQGAKATQEEAKAEALKHPQAPAGKIAFHYETGDGKMLAVYEDGTTKEFPAAQQKELQEKYPGLTADELAQFPPPSREQFQSDPEYVKARQDWGKKVGDFKEQGKIRVAAAGAEVRGKSMGRNRPVEVLDTWNGNRPIRVSAGEQEDNPDRYVNQSGGAQALGKQVTIDDIRGALTNLRAATKVLDTGTMNRAAIAAVIADPHATATQFAQSEVASHLNPDEQDYVIALLTAREVLPGLRGLMPVGQATDARVALMLQTLPGPRDPNSQFANKRIDSILGTLGRVQPGVPEVKPHNKPGAEKDGAGAAPTAAPGAAPKTAEEYLNKFKKKP